MVYCNFITIYYKQRSVILWHSDTFYLVVGTLVQHCYMHVHYYIKAFYRYIPVTLVEKQSSSIITLVLFLLYMKYFNFILRFKSSNSLETIINSSFLAFHKIKEFFQKGGTTRLHWHPVYTVMICYIVIYCKNITLHTRVIIDVICYSSSF